MGDPQYEYGVFQRRSEGYEMVGRPWNHQEDAEDFMEALKKDKPGEERRLVVRRRVVAGWENLD